MRKNSNKTGILVAIAYCFILYAILISAPPGESPVNPPWAYAMIPLGVVVIVLLFNYVIKFDFFKKK